MLTLTKLLMFLTIFFIFFCVGACVPTGGQSQRVNNVSTIYTQPKTYPPATLHILHHSIAVP
jgi:hypothetical protein